MERQAIVKAGEMSNAEVLEIIKMVTGARKNVELASYLSARYEVTITPQKLSNFAASESSTLPIVLLRALCVEIRERQAKGIENMLSPIKEQANAD